MARRRTLNRSDLRAQAEAAEAREKDADEAEGEVEEEEDEADEEAGDDEDGGKPKAKAKKPAAKKAAAPKRVRAPKEVRMKAVWVVFDNASKRVDTFAYAQKADAEALLARKQEEKKGTFYIQLVKEPMDG